MEKCASLLWPNPEQHETVKNLFGFADGSNIFRDYKKNNLSEGSLAPFCYQIKVMIVVFQPLKESFSKEFRCKKNELKQSGTA